MHKLLNLSALDSQLVTGSPQHSKLRSCTPQLTHTPLPPCPPTYTHTAEASLP